MQSHCFSLIPQSMLQLYLSRQICSFSRPEKGRLLYLHIPTSTQQHFQLLFLPSSLHIFSSEFLSFLCVAAIWLTVTNQQDNSDYGKLKFSNLLGLKYMVCISGICAGYAFVAAISSWLRFLASKAWLFFLSDQIVTYLIVTSVAAVLETLYLAYNGDQQVTWSEACSTYGKFCNKMKIAFILHALALGCFIILAVISAFRFFSMFNPPPVSSNKEVEEERT